MNLKDMGKILSMASSGEMQAFIAKFQSELDGITQDRLALRQAFPKAYLHFNARMDILEKKMDHLTAMLRQAPWMAAQDNPTQEKSNVGYDHINGSEYPIAGEQRDTEPD